MKCFFFVSTRKADRLSQITVFAATEQRAYGRALIYFKEHGYKGSPKRLGI